MKCKFPMVHTSSGYLKYDKVECMSVQQFLNKTSTAYILLNGYNTIVIVDNILCCSGESTTDLGVAIVLASLNAINYPPFGCYGSGHPKVRHRNVI